MTELRRERTGQPGKEPASLPRPYSPLGVALAAYDRMVAMLSIQLSTWRAKIVLRLLGCRYGRNLHVDGALIIRSTRRGAIRLGNNVTLQSRFRSNLVGLTNPTVIHCSATGNLAIGDHSGCSSAIFSSRTSIQVGGNVKIGGNVRIYDHDFHSLDYVARRNPQQDRAQCKSTPVVIGDDVFIGANSIILKGVTIGDRSIIGAGAVVSIKNIPPGSVVAGNPARIIKQLD